MKREFTILLLLLSKFLQRYVVVQSSESPSTKPTRLQNSLPSRNPTAIPTMSPTRIPTSIPSRKPTSTPSIKPTWTPSSPSSAPSRLPSRSPSYKPSWIPTNNPSTKPTRLPTSLPSRNPTAIPTMSPTRIPTSMPSRKPTSTPSIKPTWTPSSPSSAPSRLPSRSPSYKPSSIPTNNPSTKPTRLPTSIPSRNPTYGPTVGPPNYQATPINSDPFVSSNAYHKAQVEPDSFSFGSTTVAAIQSGRYYNGGSEGICWSTSSDFAITWKSGCLNKATSSNGGTYERASDPSVAYDAKHNVWMISMLLFSNSVTISAVGVSRSTDGLTWSSPPTIVNNLVGTLDKDWIVCDNSPKSPYYGNCYVQVDDYADSSNRLRTYMSTSSDGGVTWTTVKTNAYCFAGQPLVTPTGLVIVPCFDGGSTICSFRSTDGGKTWTDFTNIVSVSYYKNNGNMRMDPLPSAEIDGSGKVYVAWSDCRFRPGQCSNSVFNYDIVYITSNDGLTWTTPKRIPSYSTSSTYSSFIPGIAVNKASNGTVTQLALTYYFFTDGLCGTTNHQGCQLYVGFISSKNAGSSWSAPITIAGPIDQSWAPPTSLGRMVGDYISTSFLSNGNAVPIFANSKGLDGSKLNLYLATVLGGLSI